MAIDLGDPHDTGKIATDAIAAQSAMAGQVATGISGSAVSRPTAEELPASVVTPRPSVSIGFVVALCAETGLLGPLVNSEKGLYSRRPGRFDWNGPLATRAQGNYNRR